MQNCSNEFTSKNSESRARLWTNLPYVVYESFPTESGDVQHSDVADALLERNRFVDAGDQPVEQLRVERLSQRVPAGRCFMWFQWNSKMHSNGFNFDFWRNSDAVPDESSLDSSLGRLHDSRDKAHLHVAELQTEQFRSIAQLLFVFWIYLAASWSWAKLVLRSTEAIRNPRPTSSIVDAFDELHVAQVQNSSDHTPYFLNLKRGWLSLWAKAVNEKKALTSSGDSPALPKASPRCAKSAASSTMESVKSPAFRAWNMSTLEEQQELKDVQSTLSLTSALKRSDGILDLDPGRKKYVVVPYLRYCKYTIDNWSSWKSAANSSNHLKLIRRSKSQLLVQVIWSSSDQLVEDVIVALAARLTTHPRLLQKIVGYKASSNSVLKTRPWSRAILKNIKFIVVHSVESTKYHYNGEHDNFLVGGEKAECEQNCVKLQTRHRSIVSSEDFLPSLPWNCPGIHWPTSLVIPSMKTEIRGKRLRSFAHIPAGWPLPTMKAVCF